METWLELSGVSVWGQRGGGGETASICCDLLGDGKFVCCGFLQQMPLVPGIMSS